MGGGGLGECVCVRACVHACVRACVWNLGEWVGVGAGWELGEWMYLSAYVCTCGWGMGVILHVGLLLWVGGCWCLLCLCVHVCVGVCRSGVIMG